MKIVVHLTNGKTLEALSPDDFPDYDATAKQLGEVIGNESKSHLRVQISESPERWAVIPSRNINFLVVGEKEPPRHD